MSRYRFGDFVVDPLSIEVLGPDGPRQFEPQVFDVLVYLIEQRGRLVTKEELLDNVWGDRFVSESAMTTRIKQARRVLDDDGRTQWAIKTVHGRGYRFLPEVTTTETASTATPTAEPAELPDELRADARRLLHGRDDELDRALAVLDRPQDIAPDSDPFGWVWLLGEPGIGKTRLAAEIARHAHERGHRVLFGRNNEDLRVPYQPVIEAIRSSFAHVPPEQRLESVASTPAALSPLFPELAGVSPERRGDFGGMTTDADSSSDASRRYELYEAIAAWLIAAASDRPVLLIIDDVHWAAESTLQLLAHLQQRRVGAAVNIVVTSRDTAPDLNPRVVDLLASGQGMANSAVVRLAGLSGEAAVKLVGGGVELAEVMRQTAGNPLLLQAVNPEDGSVDMQSAVQRRLASLEQRVRDSLGLSSVIGLEFELTLAAAAARRDELDLLDDLEMAVAARILDDVGVDRFRFTHALIRSSLRDELSSARQARLHGRIAVAIDEQFPDDPRRLAALAHHTAEAARSDTTMRALAAERLQRAGQASMSQLSFLEAADQFERAVEFIDPAASVKRAQVMLLRGTAQTRAGQSVVAVETFEQTIGLATDSGDTVLQIEAALRHEDAAWRPGIRNDRVLGHITDALRLLDGDLAAGREISGEPYVRARLTIARLRALALIGGADEVEHEFAAAHALTRRVGVANLEAALLNTYLTQVRLIREPAGVDGLVDRLGQLEADIDDGDVALHAIHTRLLFARIAGRTEDHDELVEKMIHLQQRSHSVFWEFIRTNQSAMEQLYHGDLLGGETLAARCRDLAEDLGEEEGSGIYGLRMFLIRREQDRLAAMAPLVRHVLSQTSMGGVWVPGLALLLIETGDSGESASILEDVRSTDFDLPMDAMWSTVMVLLTECYVHLGDVDACRLLRERWKVLEGSNVTAGSGLVCFGRAERYLGMLSMAIGDLDAAEEYLGVALEADDAGGSVLWRNESRLWLSRVRRAQGQAIEADAMAAVVQREAEPAGLARLARRATADLTG